jgi:hypothetical protein
MVDPMLIVAPLPAARSSERPNGNSRSANSSDSSPTVLVNTHLDLDQRSIRWLRQLLGRYGSRSLGERTDFAMVAQPRVHNAPQQISAAVSIRALDR